jgi:hypothetical protein
MSSEVARSSLNYHFKDKVEVLMLSYNPSQIQWLSAAGVWIDIAGALILSRSFIWSKPEDLASQQNPRWVGNPELLKALSEQTVDGHWGGAMLSAGFFLQFSSNIGLTTPVAGFFAISVFSILLVGVYLFRRSRSVKATYVSAVNKMKLTDEQKKTMRDLYPT